MRPTEPHASEGTPAAEPPVAESEPPMAEAAEASSAPGQQPCPNCGHPMPDLKGGTSSICGVCGFKDSCCY